MARATKSAGALTNTPTLTTCSGNCSAISAAVSMLTRRGLASAKMKPTMSAPAATAAWASARLVVPQILTFTLIASPSKVQSPKSKVKSATGMQNQNQPAQDFCPWSLAFSGSSVLARNCFWQGGAAAGSSVAMKWVNGFFVAAGVAALLAGCAGLGSSGGSRQSPLVLHPKHPGANGNGNGKALKFDSVFFETAQGRVPLPRGLVLNAFSGSHGTNFVRDRSADGRDVTMQVETDGEDFVVRFSAQPSEGIVRWGLAVDAKPDEFFTGLMERVVDGPQQASWSPGRKEAMNLRGQKVDMILKPTTSVYAPFYISSRGYGVFVQGDWPGVFDFCKSNSKRAKIEFEGPSLALKVYTAENPATLVSRHALDRKSTRLNSSH